MFLLSSNQAEIPLDYAPSWVFAPKTSEFEVKAAENREIVSFRFPTTATVRVCNALAWMAHAVYLAYACTSQNTGSL